MRLLVCLLTGCCLLPGQVSDARYAHLARGINLTRWFLYGSPQPITATDRDLLKQAGFTAVRIAVAPPYLLKKWATPDVVARNLRDLDAGIDLFLNAGMAVTVDFQADNDYRDYYLADAGAPAELVDVWRMLASRYADRDPELLFFEIMNEPDRRFPQATWDAEQSAVLEGIRQVAPHHTVLLAPVNWSGLDALVQTQPLADRNVVYVLHYYLPMSFTHQGADWTEYAALRDGVWPGTDRDAGDIGWDMHLAAEWARQGNVRVVLNEFGVYKPFSPPDSRARWLRDVRAAAEANGIGWAMWDYGAGFDLIEEKGGVRSVDAGVAAALGLLPWTAADPIRKPGLFGGLDTVQIGSLPETRGYAEGILATNAELIVTPLTWPDLTENPVQFFVNSGDGIMRPGRFDGPTPRVRFVTSIVTGRFDRSGRAGFFLPDRDAGAGSKLLLPAGPGSLRDATENLPGGTVFSSGAAAGDVDGDGVDDLILFTPAPVLLRNDGTGHFAIAPGAFPAGSGAFGCGVLKGRDLFAFGAEGGTMFHNNGHGRFRVAAALPAPADSGRPAIGGCATVVGSKVLAAYENGMIQTFNHRHQTTLVTSGKIRRISAAAGIVVVTRAGEAPLIFNDAMVQTGSPLPAEPWVAAPGDFNRDGIADLVFAQGGGSPVVARFGRRPL